MDYNKNKNKGTQRFWKGFLVNHFFENKLSNSNKRNQIKNRNEKSGQISFDLGIDLFENLSPMKIQGVFKTN